MSHFYADVKGSHGPRTCQGTKKSGITGHIRGWQIGIRVHCWADGDVDVLDVYRTGGSRGTVEAHIATVRSDEAFPLAQVRGDCDEEALLQGVEADWDHTKGGI